MPSVTLPYPPSANRYWRVNRTGKPVPPRLLWEGEVSVSIDQYGDRCLSYVKDPFTGVADGIYRVKVYEAEAQS